MFNPTTGRIIESGDIQWVNQMFYNTYIIRSTYPEDTFHRSHEPNQVIYQPLIPNDEALQDKVAIKAVTYDFVLVPTEHDAGEGEVSDKEKLRPKSQFQVKTAPKP